MATKLNPTTDIWVLTDSGDGLTTQTALRVANYNPDIGNVLPVAATDGSLAVTVGTTDPLANTSGSATSKYSLNVLLRWLIREVRLLRNIDSTVSESAFTAIGSTTARACPGSRVQAYYIVITGYTAGFPIRMEGSAEGTNWYTLQDYNIVANGTYKLEAIGLNPYVRLTLTSSPNSASIAPTLFYGA